MKKFRLSITLALLALLTLTFTSCETDEDDPAYVGTWVSEDVEVEDGITFTYTSTLILSSSSFDMSMTLSVGSNSQTLFGMKGGLSVSGNQLTITPTSLGMADFDTGVMDWINEGDEGWDEAMLDMDFEGESETIEYLLVGNTLTIDPDDEYPEVYTRQ